MDLKFSENKAMLHLIWSTALCNKTKVRKKFKNVTTNENSYLDIIVFHEQISVNWEEFNLIRNNFDSKKINETALKVVQGSNHDLKLKCIGYMKLMANISREINSETNISSKEMELISFAQKELGLYEKEVNIAQEGLPSGLISNSTMLVFIFTVLFGWTLFIGCFTIALKQNPDHWLQKKPYILSIFILLITALDLFIHYKIIKKHPELFPKRFFSLGYFLPYCLAPGAK